MELLAAPEKSGAIAWLAVKRFDYVMTQTGAGRLHMHSACGLLDADFRTPSLDYLDLIRRVASFANPLVLASYNFVGQYLTYCLLIRMTTVKLGILQNDLGDWNAAPFFDVTFSPHPFNEHATAFDGHGKQPPLKTMQKASCQCRFPRGRKRNSAFFEVVESISQFSLLASQVGISKTTVRSIEKILEQRRTDNAVLFQNMSDASSII